MEFLKIPTVRAKDCEQYILISLNSERSWMIRENVADRKTVLSNLGNPITDRSPNYAMLRCTYITALHNPPES